MPVRAKASPGYLWRMGLIAVACFGMALWFAYDGAIGYPAQRERALRYEEFKYGASEEEEGKKDSHANEEKESRKQLEGWRPKWEAFAIKQGWPVKNPGDPIPEYKYKVQFAMAGLAAPVGLVMLGVFLRWRRRWIEAGKTGLLTSRKQQFEFGQIVALDKKRWATKGIAVVTYEENGRKRRVVLDDFKYERKPSELILRQIEANIAPEKILGGPPEPPKKK